MSAESHQATKPSEGVVNPPRTQSGDPTATPELAAYLKELPRLLAEGHAGRYALVRDDTVVSIWDTQRDVLQAGYERYGLEPFTVKRIDPRDPERFAAIQARARTACPS